MRHATRLATLLLLAAGARAADAQHAASPRAGTPSVEELLARAGALQGEVVATVWTSRHRQTDRVEVRGGKERVRASGCAEHDVVPLPDGRFELQQQVREADGDESELGLTRPFQTVADPEAFTAAQAIAHALEARERFRLVERTTLDGRDAWLLAFDARPVDPAVKDVRERVRSASRGRLWIDVREGAVLRLETELARPVHLLGGKVRKARAVRDQRPALDGAWMPTAVVTHAEVSVLTFERTTDRVMTFEAWGGAGSAASK